MRHYQKGTYIMSNLAIFLTKDYASHHGKAWKSATMKLRKEVPASVCFEIEDKQSTIIQPPNRGVSVLRRTANTVEVVDVEDFMSVIHGTNKAPSSCDFAISPSIGFDFLILNELTRTRSEYMLRFRQPQTGVEQDGKLEKAKRQLTETINRFYEVSNFCDQYAEKTALFSCRLSDKRSNGIMARSAKMFSKSISKLQKMQFHEQLPHGFVFKMRVYNAEYKLN